MGPFDSSLNSLQTHCTTSTLTRINPNLTATLNMLNHKTMIDISIYFFRKKVDFAPSESTISKVEPFEDVLS